MYFATNSYFNSLREEYSKLLHEIDIMKKNELDLYSIDIGLFD